MAARTVDLLPVARRHWYHRDQRGSWSIKAVPPAIAADLGYDGLEMRTAGGRRKRPSKRAPRTATPIAARCWKRA